MKTILITGAKGQLGLALTKQAAEYRSLRVIPVDIQEIDITILKDVYRLLSDIKPDIIINCAAYTAVDKAEADEDQAFLVNAIGPKYLAIASYDLGIPIVHISTDYVFDGKGIQIGSGEIRPYREYDPASPQTAYGRTKLEGERLVGMYNPRHYIIRTAWLYGEGQNFVKTMLNLSASQDSVRVVNDQIGSPTSAEELAKAILGLIKTSQYGLYHGTCEGSCTWYEFTKEIYRLKDIAAQVIPVTTEEYPRPAKRPHYSVLDNYLLNHTTNLRFANWQDAIAKYLLSVE